ncbi:hypothetical protein R5R35_011131 [Gryllus longicercus]|uniref:Uncharacterized protein n=1 Tax=Gryllus longicercus TaxID=2509291 RepID=A0AAN9VEE7_9ORTH
MCCGQFSEADNAPLVRLLSLVPAATVAAVPAFQLVSFPATFGSLLLDHNWNVKRGFESVSSRQRDSVPYWRTCYPARGTFIFISHLEFNDSEARSEFEI